MPVLSTTVSTASTTDNGRFIDSPAHHVFSTFLICRSSVFRIFCGKKLAKGRESILLGFTYLVTCAVHIEVAHTLKTDSYIMAMRRMISRRVKLQDIYSDNGTNVDAKIELGIYLDRWNHHRIHDSMLQKAIEWCFKPPFAPHFGRIWERLVRSCKRAMCAILQNQMLTDEVLLTVVTEVESFVNDRPLTHVSAHLAYEEAFCTQSLPVGTPEPSFQLPGVVQAAEVKTRMGTMVRPLAKLAFLEESAETPQVGSVRLRERGRTRGRLCSATETNRI